jgi:sulfotransferase family protein
MPPKPQLAYILAASHSGSTLLAMLLGSHPEVCTVGELKATSLGDPAAYRCSCGELILGCGFWTNVSRRMADRGFPFDITNARTNVDAGANRYIRRLLAPLVRQGPAETLRDLALNLDPSWRRLLAQFQSTNAALVQALLAETGKRVVVDSSKIGIRLKYLLRNPALDVRVIRLVRDGRAVALTYTDPALYADATNPARRGGGSGGSRDLERIPLQDAAREWRRSNEEAATLLASVAPARQLTISYEELCSSPDGMLKRVFRFLGVAEQADLANWRTRPHHVVGNGMRFDSSADVRLDDRWRGALDSAALRAFDTEAGALNRQLGYV